MASPEDRDKHRKRMKRKAKERAVKQKIIEKAKAGGNVVTDKRGQKHNLDEMSHADLIRIIQDNDDT